MSSNKDYNEFIDNSLNKINAIVDTMDKTVKKISSGYPTLTMPTRFDSKTNIHVFTTNDPIDHRQFIGPGVDLSISTGNTILIYKQCIVDVISFSLREFAEPIEYTAQVCVNERPSSLYAIIPDGSKSFTTTISVSLELDEFDLVCIRLIMNPKGATLQKGACFTLITKDI